MDCRLTGRMAGSAINICYITSEPLTCSESMICRIITKSSNVIEHMLLVYNIYNTTSNQGYTMHRLYNTENEIYVLARRALSPGPPHSPGLRHVMMPSISAESDCPSRRDLANDDDNRDVAKRIVHANVDR